MSLVAAKRHERRARLADFAFPLEFLAELPDLQVDPRSNGLILLRSTCWAATARAAERSVRRAARLSTPSDIVRTRPWRPPSCWSIWGPGRNLRQAAQRVTISVAGNLILSAKGCSLNVEGQLPGNADGDDPVRLRQCVQEADMVARIRFAVPMLIALATVPAPALTPRRIPSR